MLQKNSHALKEITQIEFSNLDKALDFALERKVKFYQYVSLFKYFFLEHNRGNYFRDLLYRIISNYHYYLDNKRQVINNCEEDWIETFYQVGHIYCNEGFFKKSVNAFTLAKNIYDSTPSLKDKFPVSFGDFENSLAISHEMLKDLDLAEEHYKNAFSFYERELNKNPTAKQYKIIKSKINEVYNNLGILCRKKIHFSNAIKYLNLALVGKEELKENISDVLVNLSNLYQDLYKSTNSQDEKEIYSDKAKDYLKKSIKIVEGLSGHNNMKAKFFFNYGNFQFLLKKYDVGEKYLKKSLNLFLKLDNKYFLGQTMLLLGTIEAKLYSQGKGDFDVATSYFIEAFLTLKNYNGMPSEQDFLNRVIGINKHVYFNEFYKKIIQIVNQN